MVDKIPWATGVIAWIICVLKTEFEKALLSFSKFVSAPTPDPPPHPMLKLWRNVQHCRWGGGRGWASVVELTSDCLFGACEKAPQVQICPKTFVHDCRSKQGQLVSLLFCSNPAPWPLTTLSAIGKGNFVVVAFFSVIMSAFADSLMTQTLPAMCDFLKKYPNPQNYLSSS